MLVATLSWILLALPAVLIVYAYAVYPAMLGLLALRGQRLHEPTKELPHVSIVVPAYNEELQIGGALDALVAQDYPTEKRQILVLSDASTDRTDEIVAGYEGHGVELLRMPIRGGKTAAENASCALLRGSIVINTDASIRMHPLAVRRLVEAMADPTVGVASTRDVSVTSDVATANAAEAGYVGYEMRVRALETSTGGIVGASGSGYAIRTHLHRIPVRPDLSRDFSAALTARKHGYAAVSVDDALCYVPRTVALRAEYRRKVRTIVRGMETLLHNRRLLDPRAHGLFAWKLWSHKVSRWLVPPAALLGLVGLGLLATVHASARIGLLAILLISGVAASGALWPRSRAMPRLLSVLTFALSANVAVLHALVRVVRGHEDHLWEPTRRSATFAR
jgi:glycosyltransferase involved in cell wall biosynthesis